MRAWFGLMAIAFGSACFIDFPEIRDADKICTPGDNVFCRCPGGSPGTKTCHDDGATFGECVTAPGTACSEGEPPYEPPPPPPVDPPGTKGGEDPPPQGGSDPGGVGGSSAGGGPPGVGGGGGGGPVDNCGTVDYFGECDGDQLSWCDGGTLVETDCTESQRACQLVDDTIGYDCVDPCDGVTFEGECNGDTLRYCSAQEITEVDCAAQSQVCGQSSMSSFYNCIDPPTT